MTADSDSLRGIDIPAIAGGTPVKQTPYGGGNRYGDEELAQVSEALRQQSLFFAQDGKVRALQNEMARRHGVKHAIATSSGTASIHAAMIAAGISPGDEVITAPITDMGSLVPILFQGGVPVFADIHPHSYVITPESVEARITDKTRAVLAIHLWGNACDLSVLSDICESLGIVLIEDCAQAWGCTYNGKPIGTVGQIGCFSLNEFKHISCGDGGLVITDDDELATRLRLAIDKCYSREATAAIRRPRFLANNYRMTELQGAVALAQMAKLDDIVAKRRTWVEKLTAGLKDTVGICLPEETPGCEASWWFYLLRVEPENLGAGADIFAEALRAEGLIANPHYIGNPIYEYPIFADHSAFDHASHPYAAQNYCKGMCPVAEETLETCVMLPVSEFYTEQDVDETIHSVIRVAKWFVAKKEGLVSQ